MGLKNSQKKEWAQFLITKEGMTQKEAAEKVGVSVVTMNKWYRDGEWARLKQSMLVTRQEQLNRLYMQLEELNNHIMKRPEGERFANSKEADSISKLAIAIKTMETEASIADIVEVSKRLLNWMRKYNDSRTVEIANIFNDFIKDSMKS
jgi:transcriptional regulator with XRE-family HTH domain